MAACFYTVGVYPWGPNSVLTFDLRGELLPFYGYLSEQGAGYDNLLYSMSGGLGGGFYGTASLYISPLDLIYTFVPLRMIPSVVWAMIIMKVGLCGLCCSFFLKKNGKYELYFLPTIILSCCYALMSYNITYFMSPMWYDVVFLLPVMAVFLEDIVSGKKSVRFIVITAICIICDYYIAFMAIIALVIYFLFRLIEECYSHKDCLKRLLSFAIHGILSAGMSSFILIPVILDFSRGKISSGGAVNTSVLFKFSILNLLKNILPQSYSNLEIDQVPNIYCGILVIVLAFVFFLSKKIKKRTRIAAGFVIFLYFCSFIISPLDRIWHGFRDPLSFSCRYSFTFCFFLICFALRGMYFLTPVINRRKLFRVLGCSVCIYTCIELFLNGSYIVSKIHEDYRLVLNDEYARMYEPFENLQYSDLDYFRLEKNYSFSNWDGALYGYDGIEMFSSSYNDTLNKFLYALGMDSYNNHISVSGLNPATASLFNVGYYLSYFIDYSDYYDYVDGYKMYFLYKNPNVLPLAIELSGDYTEKNRNFSEDVFNNINVVYSDIFGDGSEVFRSVDYQIDSYDSETEELIIRFSPKEEGHYWFYRGIPGETDYDVFDSEIDYHRVLSYSVDSVQLGSYGQFGYRYCADLGYLNKDQEYTLALDAPYTDTGDIYLVYLDQDKLQRLSSEVNGSCIEKIDKTGIILRNENFEECDLLISLPYESGYRVKVNGEDNGYSGYRNSLLKVHLFSGTNRIEITYFPKGLPLGIVLSCISFILMIGFALYKHGRNEKN